MKVLFDVNHAGHVHFIRNAYKSLTAQGHNCFITASDKPLVYALLKEYDLPYHPMGTIGKSLFSKLLKLIIHDIKMFLYCLRHKPDVILGIVAIRGSHAATLLRIRNFVFTDTEHASMQIALFKPFATEIHTPSWFQKSLGPKQVRYDGFHELAYLHPNNFKPRAEVLKKIGLKEGEKYFILRFVAWDATHDKNQFGISLETKREIVALFSQQGKVLISAEGPLEEEFKPYAYDLDFSYLHDALYYASILVSEGATTACEAALLGVPTLYINSLSLGYITLLEKEYDLLSHIIEDEKIIPKLNVLLESDDLKESWSAKRDDFIKSQVDTSEYIVNLIKKT